MEKAHKGKRILLASTAIYNQGEVPVGQENNLWEYIITGVNNDSCLGRTLQTTSTKTAG